ncbi:MAG TPA: methyltransferase domain-containing protein [Steroidobacteraceae bacterium]|nr:methyltransferase domain-containing protein [Steroidobacteraceae bacterium]
MTDHPYREFERCGWERAAAAYAGSFEAVSGLFATPLMDAAQIHRGSTLLDVACGPGSVTSLAAARGAAAVGLDFSPSMIAEARRRHPSLSFQEGDAEALPFTDQSFDAVIINFGIHHFPFPVRALGEARRVLRPGGRVAFTTWAPPEHHVIHTIVVGAVRESGNPGAELPRPPGGAVNEAATCMKLLGEAGFGPDSLHTELLKSSLGIRSAVDLVDLLEVGTVVLSATLRSQPREHRQAILASIEKAISGYRVDDGFRIPCAAILAVAIK